MKLKIKKGDTVQIIAGKDKGRKGEVLALNSEKMKIKVQGVRMQTHFDKKDGLKTLEGFLDYSNVKLLDKKVTEAKKKAPTKKKAVSKTA
jgi:large subunit ribosomal protein L24